MCASASAAATTITTAMSGVTATVTSIALDIIDHGNRHENATDAYRWHFCALFTGLLGLTRLSAWFQDRRAFKSSRTEGGISQL